MAANAKSFKKKGDQSTKKPSLKRKATEEASSADVKNTKRALKQARQSTRRHYDDVVRMKELWNKLRAKNNEKKEVEGMMEELMGLLNGKVQEVSMQHDASRVVQAAIQFGNPKQRESILKELISSIPALSKVQYAHFVVLKLITYCGEKKKGQAEEQAMNQQKLLLKSFKGHIPSLAVHSVGARVVELLFGTFPSKVTATLRNELYGPHLALFATADGNNTNTQNLPALLQQHPEKRDVTLQFVWNILNKGSEKSLFGFAYFQHLFWEFIQGLLNGDDVEKGKKRIQEVASSVADHSIHMLSTRDGARVVAECAAYGTAKDRKRIMKSLKGYTKSSLLHRDAYLALLRVVDVTDDTVTVQKLLLNEILVNPSGGGSGNDENEKDSPLLEIALSDTGSKLFLRLLAPNETTYFDPLELEVLAPATMKDEEGEDSPTSKKDINLRHQELLQCLRSSLIDMATRHAGVLMRSISGSKVLREVYLSFPSEKLAQAIVDATVTASSNEDSDKNKDDKAETSLFEDPVGHRFLKNLILAEAHDDDQSKTKRKGRVPANAADVYFSSAFYSKYAGSLVDAIASSNRGAFVVEALTHIDGVRDKVIMELKKRNNEIKKRAKEHKGFEALHKALK